MQRRHEPAASRAHPGKPRRRKINFIEAALSSLVLRSSIAQAADKASPKPLFFIVSSCDRAQGGTCS
jgi:hypothetical protein